ncbi:SprT family zinc-dependent metalloprotease [Pelagicoccus sp. SDUM812005]|uniref:M48 family metallopeptidase n=1 Tax=Pelagicoccus sp. SDUM812005 TaxID=3041257 RepID=UPI00280F57F3|nr:SprT family zinc-dependent metalloprotease [Pelagicoccus sp. SDUM812005]MDQ8180353.1 SprT family zinc-dependent metalloprotease [Pelagicoccus sp. SDUM812005]
MVEQLKLKDLSVDLVRKRIKNVHLSVYPPTGRVRIAAPEEMNLETIRAFAANKLPWIRRQQRKQLAQKREPKREFLERESHYLWGRRYLLSLAEEEAKPKVELKHRKIVLTTRPGASESKRRQIMEEWYRQQLLEALPAVIFKWETVIGAKVSDWQVRKMKTKWGSCIPQNDKIIVNLELAKKPKECLDYIVAHEIVHLLEPTHNERFKSLMNLFVPQWREHRKVLNRIPVSHREWSY